MTDASAARMLGAMAEIALGIFLVGVLFIADPDRLQSVIDQVREFAAWLAE
jgi:hypothetical protein